MLRKSHNFTLLMSLRFNFRFHMGHDLKVCCLFDPGDHHPDLLQVRTFSIFIQRHRTLFSTTLYEATNGSQLA